MSSAESRHAADAVREPARGRTAPAHLLVVSPRDSAARAMQRTFDPSDVAVVRALSLYQAMRFIRRVSIDAVVLCDAGDASSAAAIGELRDRLIRHQWLGISIPIIVACESVVPREDELALLRAGAWDVLAERFDAQHVSLLLVHRVGARRQVRSLHDRALVDEDTGMYNRPALLMRLDEIASHAARARESLACIAVVPALEPSLLAALPRDRAIVMAGVADATVRCARTSDAVGWISDTEIGVVAHGADRLGALRFAERLGITLRRSPLGGGAARPAVALAICAIDDFSRSALDAVHLLLRASAAAADARQRGVFDTVRVVEDASDIS